MPVLERSLCPLAWLLNGHAETVGIVLLCLCLVFGITLPVSRMLFWRMFAEIRKIPRKAGQIEAYQEAQSLRRSRLSLGSLLWHLATVSSATLVIVYDVWIGLAPLVASIAIVGHVVTDWWIIRRDIHDFLRKKLCALGLPVCINCGYDLRGNVSGSCPECGVKPAADGG